MMQQDCSDARKDRDRLHEAGHSWGQSDQCQTMGFRSAIV
jgi:hypothetical protein